MGAMDPEMNAETDSDGSATVGSSMSGSIVDPERGMNTKSNLTSKSKISKDGNLEKSETGVKSDFNSLDEKLDDTNKNADTADVMKSSSMDLKLSLTFKDEKPRNNEIIEPMLKDFET